MLHTHVRSIIDQIIYSPNLLLPAQYVKQNHDLFDIGKHYLVHENYTPLTGANSALSIPSYNNLKHEVNGSHIVYMQGQREKLIFCAFIL